MRSHEDGRGCLTGSRGNLVPLIPNAKVQECYLHERLSRTNEHAQDKYRGVALSGRETEGADAKEDDGGADQLGWGNNAHGEVGGEHESQVANDFENIWLDYPKNGNAGNMQSR